MLRVRDLSLMGDKKIRKTLLGASFVLFLFLYGVLGLQSPLMTETAIAQESSFELVGYAFSPGIGLISFNCKNTGDCAASDYKVSYNPTSKTFSGFAWSGGTIQDPGGLGWVKFGGLSDFPGPGGNIYMDENDRVHGWIRVCSGTADGLCGTMEDDEGGWDGWISISGTDPDYGPSLNEENKLIGYSWGSDVVGWVDWSPFVPECTGFCGVTIQAPFEFDFVSPLPLEIDQGTSGSRDLEINLVSGLPETITLTHGSVSNPDITIDSLLPGTCEPDCTSTISVSVGASVPGGNYPVLITATPLNSEEAVSRILTIVVPSLELSGVSCSASRVSGFVGQTLTWTAAVSGEGGSYTYRWSGDEGLSGNSVSEQIQYQSPGTKTAEVIVTDLSTTARATCTADIQIRNAPTYEEF